MTEPVHRERAAALARCTMIPASWDKRFARDVAAIAASGADFTPRQIESIDRLAYKYRRQMPASLVPAP